MVGDGNRSGRVGNIMGEGDSTTRMEPSSLKQAMRTGGMWRWSSDDGGIINGLRMPSPFLAGTLHPHCQHRLMDELSLCFLNAFLFWLAIWTLRLHSSWFQMLNFFFVSCGSFTFCNFLSWAYFWEGLCLQHLRSASTWSWDYKWYMME